MITSVDVGVAIAVVHFVLRILPAHSRNPCFPKPEADVVALAHFNKSSSLASERLIALNAGRLYASSFCIPQGCVAHCLAQIVSTCSGLILLVPLEITMCAGSWQEHTSGVWLPQTLVAS